MFIEEKKPVAKKTSHEKALLITKSVSTNVTLKEQPFLVGFRQRKKMFINPAYFFFVVIAPCALYVVLTCKVALAN